MARYKPRISSAASVSRKCPHPDSARGSLRSDSSLFSLGRHVTYSTVLTQKRKVKQALNTQVNIIAKGVCLHSAITQRSCTCREVQLFSELFQGATAKTHYFNEQTINRAVNQIKNCDCFILLRGFTGRNFLPCLTSRTQATQLSRTFSKYGFPIVPAQNLRLKNRLIDRVIDHVGRMQGFPSRVLPVMAFSSRWRRIWTGSLEISKPTINLTHNRGSWLCVRPKA